MISTRLSLSLSRKKLMSLVRGAGKSETAVILSPAEGEGSQERFFPLSCFCKKTIGQNDGYFLGSLKPSILAVALCFFLSPVASANNVAFANAKLLNKNALLNTIAVQFDISWDNAWYNATSNDAVWVFGKYCLSDCADGGTGTWHHMTIGGLFTHGSGSPSIDIFVPSDKKGAFVQLQNFGDTGTVSKTGTQLVWDYGADGVSDTQATQSGMKFRLFAIEMVYIPEGSFTAGDGASANSLGLAGNSLWGITSESEITTTNSSGNWQYQSGGNSGEANTDEIFTIPAAFPKGYGAFYLMKYEMSQGQYVRFLNTLTRTQQQTRVASDISGDAVANNFVMVDSDGSPNRNTIQCPTTGNGTSPARVIFNTGSRDSRAASDISWPDLMAYADWAGLRPITELEFEKAARGPEAPVAGEYAWGTTNITACDTISGTEDGTEYCATGGANCNYNYAGFTNGDGDSGPLRVGIFATGSSDTREKSGAGYYGNLDLTGNESERTVTVGNATGRAFTGTHGDGALSTNGNADVADWPGYSSGEVTGAAGSGFRGGDGYSGADSAGVSDRETAALEDATRVGNFGGRVGRTAP